MTVAHRNCERLLIHVLNQRNEAWNEENALRARQVELEQQLAATEEYNDHLHEEVHLLHNQLHPLLPPDDENDNEDEELEPASDEDGGEIFDTDSEDNA